ncbi:hypothetical protein ABIA51_001193 [Erwinia aphidicola]
MRCIGRGNLVFVGADPLFRSARYCESPPRVDRKKGRPLPTCYSAVCITQSGRPAMRCIGRGNLVFVGADPLFRSARYCESPPRVDRKKGSTPTCYSAVCITQSGRPAMRCIGRGNLVFVGADPLFRSARYCESPPRVDPYLLLCRLYHQIRARSHSLTSMGQLASGRSATLRMPKPWPPFS